MLVLKETASKLFLKGPTRDLYDLSFKLRFRPRNFAMSPRYQLWRQTAGKQGWDGWLYPLAVNQDKGTATIGRGYLDNCLRLINEFGLEVDTQLLPRPFAALTLEDLPDDLIKSKFTLDQFQLEAVVSWLKNGVGIHRVTVGGGKTATFCTAAAMIKRRYPKARFLYFTPTERLVKQVMKESRGFLPSWDITQFGGGVRNPDGKDMVVACTATLRRNYDELTESGWFNTFMAFLVDEAQADIKTVTKILMHSGAYFRLGASDTTRDGETNGKLDDPGRNHELKALFGAVQIRVEAGELIDSGRLARPSLYLVDNQAWSGRYDTVPHSPEPGSEAWVLTDTDWLKGKYMGPAVQTDDFGEAKKDKDGNVIVTPGVHLIELNDELLEYPSRLCLLDRTRDRAVIRFKQRNDLIVEWAKHWADDRGFQTLVVCTPTLHVAILRDMIEKVIGPKRLRVLTGEDDGKSRDKTFAWFEKTKGSVLISSIVKVGVSLNFIQGGVIADYVRSWELANQLVGRFIRKKEGDNTAHITMFLERQHAKMYKGSLEVVSKLDQIRGYRYLHPVIHPSDIATAKVYETVKVT